MAEPQSAPPSGGAFDLNSLMKKLNAGDGLFMSLGFAAILGAIFVPLPPMALDMALAISLTFSILILMTVLFLEKPLDFSSFPSILLIATLLRIALNISSTRLILAEGHSGTDAAGKVIGAFGSLVMQNDYIIGLVVFAIIVIVNFIVITKGSGRIAEVAARFSLDAMPGKQMAIDSDLSAGLLSEEEAKQKRKELEQESSFFGAMDGAAKFVRGDAIAGILIVFVNIIGGIIIGSLRQNLGVGEAAEIYIKLTIGDGLVSQIPSLIISVAAGMMVSKGAEAGSTNTQLIKQFSSYPRAMAISAGLLFIIGLLPGMPKIPFFALATILGTLAYVLNKEQKAMLVEKEAQSQVQQQAAAKPAEEPISRTLAMDTIRLELGYGLLSLVGGDSANGVPKLTDQIKGLRRQLAEEMGFVLPSVRIQDNLQLPANAYAVMIKEIEAGRGDVRPDMLMCMDPAGEPITLPGENTIEPTFGLPAMWVDQQYREEASFKGYTVVDAATVVTTHLTEIVKDNMPDLLSYSETQKLLDEMPQQFQKLSADVVPGQISINGLQRILQNLVAERVSVRDMPTILEGVSEAAAYTKSVALITEHVRARLGRQICSQNTNIHGVLPMVTLSAEWEQMFAESLLGEGEEKQLAMPPSQLQKFITQVRDVYDEFAQSGENPIMLTSPGIRPYVRSVVERFRPQTVVMSQNEIHAKAKIKTVGQV